MAARNVHSFPVFGISCDVPMKVKPLNTEANRTALAERIVQSLSQRELYDFAVYVMATDYDRDADLFYADWERYSEENDD